MTAKLIAAALFVVGFCAPVGALAEEGFEGARSLAMGGALRAAAVSTPSLYLNPAALASGQLYHVETAYQYDAASTGHLANAAIVDSTNAIAAGLGALYHVSDVDDLDRTAYDLRLGLAVPFARTFSLGGTIKYLHLSQEGNDGEQTLLDDFTVDAGALLRLGDLLSIGASGYNLTNLDTPEAPLKVGFGAAVSLLGVAVIDGDVVLDLTTYEQTEARYALGAEYFAANRYPLRIGYAYDAGADAQFLSGGLGYVDQRFAADASLRQQVTNGSSTTLTVALRFFLQ